MPGIDSYTKLMLHCDGVDGSTTFTDSSLAPYTMTAVSGAQIDTAQSKFGGASGLFNGSNSYIYTANSADWAYGTGAFTIDCWVRFNSLTGAQIILAQDDGSNNRFSFYKHSTNKIAVFFDDSGVTIASFSTTNSYSFSTGTWYHLALVRDGDNIYIFINGQSQAITYSVQPDASTNFPNYSLNLWLGKNYYGNYFNGWIDEFRISKGIARWTSNFTPPTSAYDETPIVDIVEEITLDDNWQIQVNPEQQAIDETVTIDDSWDIQLAGIQEVNIDETIKIDDSWDVFVNPEIQTINEEITLSDSWTVTTVEITDNGSQIIWLNPLILVTNSNPAKISEIDITDPENPVKTTYELVGCTYAKGVVYNATNEYFYVICAEGKVCKVNKNNLEDQTIISTGETDIFVSVDALDSYLKTFAITDNSGGEIVMIDEREVKKINTDLRWLESIQQLISTRLDWINGKLINTDLRWLAEQTKMLKTDLRWLSYNYDDVAQYLLDYTDWVVKINGVDMVVLNDVDLDTIQIVHDITAEEEKGSTATFVLHRKHDKLDYTNAGTASQITNNNTVIVEINGIQEFSGKISNLNCDSEGEIVTVTAIGSRPTDKRHTQSIPLAIVNEQLHPYHCILSNPVIDHPYIDNRFVITSDNNKYWNGSSWVAKKSSSSIYADYSTAESYLEGISENNTTFWDANPLVRNYEASPQYYKGIQIDLGTEIEQNIQRYSAIVNTTTLASQIEDGTFKPKQNWDYFWLAKFQHLVLGLIAGTLRYIGTSIGSLSTDAWKINGASYKYQKQSDDTETELGVYQVGSAPYNVISVTNGRKITKQKWEDRKNGLYNVKEASYDYREYVKRIAALEYQKIQNINGQVLPSTSCQISLTLDAYYYYNIGLLTRINLTNTTIANTYNGNNGFPVAVKTITIKCATQGRNSMLVTLNCDNQKSQVEMEELDAQYPDENSDEFVFPEEASLLYRKFDPTSWSYPS